MKTVIHLDESFRSPSWQRWMEELPQLLESLPDSQLLQKGRNLVYWVEHEGKPFVLKYFLNRGPWKKIAYRLTSGKARRSFEHSAALIAAGLHCPQPVGWREDWSSGFLKESFFICRYVNIAHTARAIRTHSEIDWHPHVEKLGRAFARMHDARLLHRDLTPGNILFVETTDENWPIYFIDNNRMSFGNVNLRQGVRSLLQPKVEGKTLDPFIAAYAEARGFDFTECLDLYNRLIAGYERKWRIKNLTRPWRRKIGL